MRLGKKRRNSRLVPSPMPGRQGRKERRFVTSLVVGATHGDRRHWRPYRRVLPHLFDDQSWQLLIFCWANCHGISLRLPFFLFLLFFSAFFFFGSHRQPDTKGDIAAFIGHVKSTIHYYPDFCLFCFQFLILDRPEPPTSILLSLAHSVVKTTWVFFFFF